MEKAPWELSAKDCIQATKWERRKSEACKEQLQPHGQGCFGSVPRPRLFSKRGFECLKMRYSAWEALGPRESTLFLQLSQKTSASAGWLGTL